MVEISDPLRLLFETTLEDEGDRYAITVPKELVEGGSISAGETFRVALLEAADTSGRDDSGRESGENRDGSGRSHTHGSDTASRAPDPSEQGPPVEEGEVRSVTIDTLGDQGDGIAKVDRGFIVIVSDTQPGDQVDVEITDVKDTVAFAEPVSDATVR